MRRLNRSFSPYAAMAATWLSILAPVALGDGHEPTSLLPPDTLAVAGWHEVLDDESAALLKVVPALMRTFEAGDDEIARVERILGLAEIVGRKSGAVALVGVDTSGFAPIPLLALVVNAGGDAAKLAGDLATITNAETTPIAGVQFHMSMDPTLYFAAIDGDFVLTNTPGIAEGIVGRLKSGGDSLASSGRIAAVRKKAGIAADAKASLYGFVDAAAVVKLVVDEAEASGTADVPRIQQAFNEFGIYDLRELYFEASGSTQDIRSYAFIGTNGEHRGILKLWDQAPLTDADLAIIPKDAYWAVAFNFDWSTLWAEVQRVVEAMDPDALATLEGSLAMVDGILGVSITNDLLPAIGDTWTFFDAPDHGGILITGAVGVMEVKNQDAVRAMFARLVQMATPLAAQAHVALQSRTIESDGQKIEYLVAAGLPTPIAPAVAFVGDRAVFGLTPQVVKTALRHIDPATRGQSILDHQDVKAARKVLPKSFQTFFYEDSHFAVRTSYWVMNMIGTALSSAAMRDNPAVDPGMLPTLPEALANMHDAVSVCSVSDDGILYTGCGSAAIAAPQLEVGVIAMLISILLPSLARARQLAKRAVSASNLRGIGIGMHIYANDNRDQFPETLDQLIAGGIVMPNMLVSPRDPVLPSPESFKGYKPAEGESYPTSYVYIAGQTASSDYTNVIAYEKVFDDEGTNVLFLDGHVEWMHLADFRDAVRATYERLGRENEMPAEFRN